MPIKAFIGRPRQGKSYSVTKNVILKALRAGRLVVTNIPMKKKAYEEFEGLIYFQYEIDYKNIIAGAVYVIDEIWKDCESGQTAKTMSQDLKHFIAMHGHDSNDDGITTEIVIITQNLKQICTYITELIETTYYVEKIQLSSTQQRCRTNEYNGSVTGNPPRVKPVAQRLDKYDSDVFEYYKSHTTANEEITVVEMDAVSSKKLTDLPIVRYGLPLSVIAVILGIYFFITSFNRMFSDKNDVENQENEITEIQQTIQTKKVSTEHNSYTKKLKPTTIKKVNKSQRKKEIKEFYDFTDELTVFPMSENMRLTGKATMIVPPFYSNDWWELTIDNKKVIQVPSSHVKKDVYGQFYLVYRNQIVTEYTGEEPLIFVAQYMPDGSISSGTEEGAVINTGAEKDKEKTSFMPSL